MRCRSCPCRAAGPWSGLQGPRSDTRTRAGCVGAGGGGAGEGAAEKRRCRRPRPTVLEPEGGSSRCSLGPCVRPCLSPGCGQRRPYWARAHLVLRTDRTHHPLGSGWTWGHLTPAGSSAGSPGSSRTPGGPSARAHPAATAQRLDMSRPGAAAGSQATPLTLIRPTWAFPWRRLQEPPQRFPVAFTHKTSSAAGPGAATTDSQGLPGAPWGQACHLPLPPDLPRGHRTALDHAPFRTAPAGSLQAQRLPHRPAEEDSEQAVTVDSGPPTFL